MADRSRFVQATFRTNVNAGILVLPSSASTGIDADLEGVIAVGNGTGISAANGVRMQIKRSDTPEPASIRRGAGSDLNVDDSTASDNGTGLLAVNSGAADIEQRHLAQHHALDQSPDLVRQNRALGNTNPGTAPPPAGSATSDFGQI